MRNGWIIGVVLLAVGSCKSESSRVAEPAVWQTTSADAPRTDGCWRFCYPANTHVLAEGRISGGLRVGTWSFYYRDGSRLARGSFSESGEMEGTWVFWQPDGAVCRQRHGMVCDGTVLGEFRADHYHFSDVGLEEFASVMWILPITSGSPHGSGYYVDGVWKRPVPVAELRPEGKLGSLAPGEAK